MSTVGFMIFVLLSFKENLSRFCRLSQCDIKAQFFLRSNFIQWSRDIAFSALQNKFSILHFRILSVLCIIFICTLIWKSILKIIGKNLICLTVYFIICIDSWSFTHILARLLCCCKRNFSWFAPQRSRIIRCSIIEAVIDLHLSQSVRSLVNHIVPDRISSSQCLFRTWRNTHTCSRIIIIHGLTTQIICIISCCRYDIYTSVIHVNQVISLLIHSFRICPSIVPDIHLNPFASYGCASASCCKTSPQTNGISIILDISQKIICKLTELLCILSIILICSDINYRIPVKYRVITLNILIPDALNKCQWLIILRIQIEMVILTSGRSESEIRSYLCKWQRMCRSIKFRDNIQS